MSQLSVLEVEQKAIQGFCVIVFCKGVGEQPLEKFPKGIIIFSLKNQTAHLWMIAFV